MTHKCNGQCRRASAVRAVNEQGMEVQVLTEGEGWVAESIHGKCVDACNAVTLHEGSAEVRLYPHLVSAK